MNNTQLLCFVLGWQGGTVHLVSKATGLSVEQILGARPESMDHMQGYTQGWWVVRTCEAEARKKIFKLAFGSFPFWMGAIAAMELTIKLKDSRCGYFAPKQIENKIS